jgi:VanZ family protein
MVGTARIAEGVCTVASLAARVSRRRRWAAAALWYGVIFALSQARGTDAATTWSILDMVALGDLNGLLRLAAHVSVFGVLGCLLYLALGGGSPGDRPRRAALAVLLTAVLGAGDELHQWFVPHRFGRPVDVLYDTIGAALVLATALAASRWARRRAGLPTAG